MIPSIYTTIPEGSEEEVERMLEIFEDDDDVQDVYHNASEEKNPTYK